MEVTTTTKANFVDLGFLPDIVGESIGCKGGGEKSGARVWAEAHEEEEEDGFHLPRKSYEWEISKSQSISRNAN